VQEVLAERQFRIAHVYFLRDNLAASQARLESLIESYPLYSNVDEALFELGTLYEKEAMALRKQKIPEAQREKLVAQFEKKAIEAYSKIVTRYPATDRVPDAKHRLEALKAPIPEPTPDMVAESKAEESSRGKVGMVTRVTGNFKKHPNVAMASKVGEPPLNDEVVESAPAMVNALTKQINSMNAESLGVQAIGAGTGTPPASDKSPASQGAAAAAGAASPAATGTTPAQGVSTEVVSGSGEGAPPSQAPAQVNEIQKPTGEGVDVTQAPGTTSQKAQKVDKKQESSSKKKGKKGLHKLIPF
jgi:outer membrane protein assembly factor BamD